MIQRTRNKPSEISSLTLKQFLFKAGCTQEKESIEVQGEIIYIYKYFSEYLQKYLEKT